MNKKLLTIKDLSVIYKTEKSIVNAVNKINLEVGRKETIGLVGETGAGKTTTALAIMQLLPERTGKISGGEIIFNNENLLNKSKNDMRYIRGERISMIFQDPMTSLNPIMPVGKQIMESLEIHNHERKSKEELEEEVNKLLNLVGISPKRKNNYPHQFSGGMKQRIVIAISLACNPELIIADEPTTALDVTIQSQILSLMAELKENLNTSTIMITHDLGVVAQTCDKVAIMYAGEIVEKGTVKDIFEGDKHHPYTKGLFDSIPDIEIESRRLNSIDGLMPDPTDLPQGCKFHPRCPKCMEICKKITARDILMGTHYIKCNLFN